MTGILVRERRIVETQKHREESHVKTEAETEGRDF
jgi:hypothetical protein